MLHADLADDPVKVVSSPPSRLKNRHSTLVVLGLVLVVAFVASLVIGRYPIPLTEVWDVLVAAVWPTSPAAPSTQQLVILNVRLPRIGVALIVGAALATSGAAYQGVFKNPMVSPDILGAAAGSGFGAAMAILLDAGTVGIEASAFIGGLVAVAITYTLGNSIGRGNNAVLVLVLTGMVVQALFTAFISITKFVADPNNKLPEITFWLMGGLSSVGNSEFSVLIAPFLVGVTSMILLRWKLNVLSFGDEEARALGVNSGRIRLVFIVAATLLTSSSIAVAGMIGWVGLIIPHLARLLVGPDARRLLPASLLIGATYLLVVDDIARTAFPTEIPLGILTAIIGAPFFLALLVKGRESW